MKTDLRKKAKNDFEKDFFKQKNNAVFGKTMENVTKHIDIKLVTTKRRNYLVSEPNYYTTNSFAEHLLAIDYKSKEILVNTLLYLGLSILELSKILMYEFWYDYAKPKLLKKQNCFIVYIKTNDIYKDIAEDIEIRFDVSNYELEKLLPKGKSKKVIGLIKD